MLTTLQGDIAAIPNLGNFASLSQGDIGRLIMFLAAISTVSWTVVAASTIVRVGARRMYRTRVSKGEVGS
jgi:hypothetical protein